MLTTRSIRSRALCVFLGAAIAGGGSLAPSARAANLTTLASFDGNNGRTPASRLVIDADHNLYGTTSDGPGRSSNGTVFKFDLNASVLTTLVTFNGANGSVPLGGLMADADGNLYGTTSGGGASNRGTVFKLHINTGHLTTLASFGSVVPNSYTGTEPVAGLIADAAGNLYGTAPTGGEYRGGTIFKFDPNTSDLTALVSFGFGSGATPRASLIADAAGNFYGTTFNGWKNIHGTIFKFDPATGALSTLVSFDGANGSKPLAGLIADAAGNLYGTTQKGGTNDLGTLFKFDPAIGVLTTLLSFDGANGSLPTADLIIDAAGNLYGTAQHGGVSDFGTVFKFDPITGALSTLVSFDGANGSAPFAGLIADSDGNLYGTTNGGGTNGRGTVFKLTDTGFVVPEPASLLLVALGVVATLHRRCS